MAQLPPAASGIEAVARIHPFAGLGHQISGMIAAELWARDLGLALRPEALPADPEGVFFRSGSNDNEARPASLMITRDERDPTSLQLLRAQMIRRIERTRGEPSAFAFALDQPRWDQTPASDWLRSHFLNGPLANSLREAEAQSPYVAVHVRRSWFSGDISPSTNPERWIGIDWYVDLIRHIRQHPYLRDLQVLVFSLGDAREFEPLTRLPNVEIRLNGHRDEDLVGLAAARLLVAAPSSFSFTAGLLSRGAVLARYPWWHRVPNAGRWAHIDSAARVEVADLHRSLEATELSS